MKTMCTRGPFRWAPWLAAAAVLAAACTTRTFGAVPVPNETLRRVLSMLDAAAEDYREGVRDGTVIRPTELVEAKGFIEEAQQRIEQLTLDVATAGEVRALLSSANAAIDSGAPAAQVANTLSALGERLTTATGISPEVFPPSAPSGARGQRLFEDNCVSCHGEHGDGKGPSAAQLTPRPANFTDPEFMRGETPYDFFHVISLGKRDTAMPAWDAALTGQDRWDLVAYLWTLAPGTAGIAEGQGVYLTQCASCHGAAADGHAAFADVLIKPAPDLSRLQALAQQTDAELFAKATDGVNGSPMPGFARSLSADDRWKAIAFLRALSLGGALPATGSSGTGAGPDGKRFAGLVRLLAREYALAWSGDQLTNPMEYDEAGALAEQVTRVALSFAQGLEADAPDVAQEVRADVAGIVSEIHDRGAVAHVTAAADALAAIAETRTGLPDSGNARPAGAAKELDAALTASLRLVDAALAADNGGDSAAAGMVADAYLEFEPVEKRLGATAPGLKTAEEEHFMELRQSLRSPNHTAAVRRVSTLIRSDFAEVRTALRPHNSAYALFLESATIILREGFEMVLVIGALLAYVLKTGHTGMRRAIYAGTALGVIASVATAAVMGEVVRLHPSSSDMLEGITMLLAAVVLFWVSYWLISKAEADRWQRYIRGKVQSAVGGRRTLALAGTAFLAVYREGFETVLFYQALYASAATQSLTVSAGFLAGAFALAVVYLVFRRFEVQIPIQQFFVVTGLLLYVMAAVFAGQGMHELQDAGAVGVTSIGWMPTVPLLGIFPSVESVGIQAVFVGLLLYATAVTLRRRRRAPAEVEDSAAVVAELGALRGVIEAVRRELARLQTAGALDRGGIEAQVTSALLQVERVAGQIGSVKGGRVVNPDRPRTGY
jgi:high-affinity iron transporter